MKEENEGRPMGQVIKIDEARIRDHLGEMVRGTVEETLNAMLASPSSAKPATRPRFHAAANRPRCRGSMPARQMRALSGLPATAAP